MYLLQLIIALVLNFSGHVLGQEVAETLWAVFSFNVHGDSTPYLLASPRTLTPIGAQNLYDVGSAFRDRYVMGAALNFDETPLSQSWVQGLAQHRLDSEEVRVYSTSDQYTEASALAFMQGFYPPISGPNDTFHYMDEAYLLANGSSVASPLNDYQYPRMYAAGLTDANSIYVAGQMGCDMHQKSTFQYLNSPQFREIESENADFYSHLYDVALEGLMDESSVGYARAKDIFEYLDYEYLHNSSLGVSSSDLQRARALASQYSFDTNGNLSASGMYEGDMIQAISGRTLSRLILQSFEDNIETQGSSSKITLVFGGTEPITAFAALTQLASSMNGDFYGLPVTGASLVLEMFSINSTSDSSYPQISDLFVRFLFHNGTSGDEAFTQYPLFGHGPSSIDMPFTDFVEGLGDVLIPSTHNWCTTCNSSSVYCLGAVSPDMEPTKGGLTLAGAGAIGAAVTIAVLSIIAGIAWLCGIELHRRQKSTSTGGFKGGSKMVGDQDVDFTNPSSGVFRAGILGFNKNGAQTHERSGSWEMKNKSERIDDDGMKLDDEDDTVEAMAGAEPVQIHETV
ncbi:histidine phosphatase superfamily [Talaromyces proteolyticus]|uniref:Histidine phosphatase superfamily n=1 Tax=Talaromyces proteolyticus TaxID=1131652 RepID=A0AAD4L123_9EURO|nr:histidine phosphatase superfamily [Talaromyces proteolyticus]KAH8705149.1 histidine phosphatase superfamily [Talaromyces proteolyticus]